MLSSRAAAPRAPVGKLLAISDLHISYAEEREIADASESDRLIIAGDVGEIVEDVEEVPRLLGEHRYRELVEICRLLDLLTTEDPYPLRTGEGGPARIVPMFVGCAYSFFPPGARNKTEGIIACTRGVVCSDAFLLRPDPHPSGEGWCSVRIAETERRLSELDFTHPTVLVNHYPLVREPTDVLRSVSSSRNGAACCAPFFRSAPRPVHDIAAPRRPRHSQSARALRLARRHLPGCAREISTRRNVHARAVIRAPLKLRTREGRPELGFTSLRCLLA